MAAFTFEDGTGAIKLTGEGYLQDTGNNPQTVIKTSDSIWCHMHLIWESTMPVFANTLRLVGTVSFEGLGTVPESNVTTILELPFILPNTPTDLRLHDLIASRPPGAYHCVMTCLLQYKHGGHWHPLACAGFAEIPVIQYYDPTFPA